ncbi:hypothetical protein G3I23_02445, partial [Streptomyces sp. SID10115]|nr:hypothetical protein [Streptomyces sp. SID10115]
WRALRVDELYHSLCAGPRAALPGVLREGIEACRFDTAVAREWARVVADAAEDTGAEHLRVWSDDLGDALADDTLGALRALELLLTRAHSRATAVSKRQASMPSRRTPGSAARGPAHREWYSSSTRRAR